MTSGPADGLETDLLSPEAIRDPHAVYRSLREHAPVTWLPEHRAWFVATYDEVRAGFRDERLSSDRLTPLERRLSDADRAVLGDTFDLLRGWMVFHDPPAHERLRGPLRRTFTPRTVERLRPHVIETVDAHLDAMAARFDGDEPVDLIGSLAFPLPAIVIAELLGVPPSDRDEFKTWSDQLAAIVFGTSAPDRAERAAAGTARFVEYFTDLVARYERSPADNLISAMIVAAVEAEPPLSPMELVGACTLLLFGGHETTTNLLANSVVTLLSDPGRRDRFAGSTHRAEIAVAAEELHRYDGSSKVMVRIAAVDHVRAGVEIAAGDTVFLGIASANRDPAEFARPDDVVLDRADAQRHLGFGYGLHFCLGAPLARLESYVALERLLARFPDLTLAVAPDDIEYGATILGRGPVKVPLAREP